MPTMVEGKKNKKQVNGAQIYSEIFKKVNIAVIKMFKFTTLLYVRLIKHIDNIMPTRYP